MRLQTNINDLDYEDLSEYCNRERVSVSALLNTLVLEFLETTDKERVAFITEEAKKVKQGRPVVKEQEG